MADASTLDAAQARVSASLTLAEPGNTLDGNRQEVLQMQDNSLQFSAESFDMSECVSIAGYANILWSFNQIVGSIRQQYFNWLRALQLIIAEGIHNGNL